MENIILAALALVGAALVYLIWILQQPKQDLEQSKLLENMKQDQAERHRAQESLKAELRYTTQQLQTQFDRVNKNVDFKLTESSKQLNERLDKSSQVIGSLQRELGKMGEIGAKIEQLDKVLRAPKTRGSLGEETLEEILRMILPPNLWERQYALGTGAVVDVILKTTNGLIPIDAKFPLPDYERLVSAEDDTARAEAQKGFAKAVKARIQEVTKYLKPELGTLDFAILFLPNEGIYYEANVRSREIYDYARERKIYLAGPNNLVLLLQTIFSAYQSQQFAQQAQEALAQLSGVQKQAAKLDDAVRLVGTHLGRAGTQLSSVETENKKLQQQIHKVGQLSDGAGESEEDKKDGLTLL